MTKVWLVFVLFSMVVLQSEAQKRDTVQVKADPEKMAERMTARMAEKLDLSEEQKEKVHALHLERATQRIQERETRRDKMKSLHQEEQKKLDAILTPEQKAKWEARRNEVREKKQHRHEGRKGVKGERNRKHRQQIDA